MRRRTLGDEHPDTLDSITNLSLHHTETGNLGGNLVSALKLSEEVVAATRRMMGNDEGNSEAAHAFCSLAAVHNLMGVYELAQPLHMEALEMRLRLFGEEHVDTLNSKYNLAQCLVGLREHEHGLEMLEEVAVTARRVLGETHPSYEHFSNGLAAVKERGDIVELVGNSLPS